MYLKQYINRASKESEALVYASLNAVLNPVR
jgi:hypothetical protein